MQNVYYMHKTWHFNQNSYPPHTFLSQSSYLLTKTEVPVNQHFIYRVSQEERTKLREGVTYVKLYRYNPKRLYPKLNGYGDNGKRSLKL